MWMIERLRTWGLVGIGLVYTLEALGIPVPIEVPLWLSGQMIQNQQASVWELWLVTWTGTVIGNILAFSLARLIGERLIIFVSERLKMNDQVERVQRWVAKYGLGAVLLTRWINWGYAPSLWLAGVTGMPAARTLAIVVVNCGAWALAWVLLGRVIIGGMSGAGLPTWLLLLPPVISVSGIATWRLVKSARRPRNS